MTRLILCLLLASNWSFAAGYEAIIANEQGVAITDVKVSVNGIGVSANERGLFPINPGDHKLARIEVAAKGYYRFIHTLDKRDLALASPMKIELVEKKPSRRLLLFTGDAMLARRYFNPRADEPVLVSLDDIADEGRRLLDPIRAYIGLADYASVNLETQLSAEVPTGKLPKSVTFYSPPEFATILENAGFDYVALGNNHTYDYRDDGLDSTLDALVATGLDFSGAGRNEAEARQPHTRQVHGQPYAFLSYVGWKGSFSPHQAAEGDKGGAAYGDQKTIASDVARISPTTTSVVQLHSGIEYADHPAMSERTILRDAVDAGADIAIGHHSHVLQGFELYKNKLIAYSLGNFLFDQYIYSTQVGMMLYVWMDGDRFHRAEIVPMHVNGYVPTPATGDMRYASLHRLARLSADNGICMDSNGAHAVIRWNGHICLAQSINVPARHDKVISLRSLGLSPLDTAWAPRAAGQYRLGTDILRRGDFESAGLFGTTDRGWIETDFIKVRGGENQLLGIHLLPGQGSVTTGMKVFDRVFTVSNPTTLSGRIRAEGNVSLKVRLQRRTTTAGLSEALETGPLMDVGEIKRVSAGWVSFHFDFNQPRSSTKGVRLLLEFTDQSENSRGARIELDDLTWVEWKTPWLESEAGPDSAEFATHMAVR